MRAAVDRLEWTVICYFEKLGFPVNRSLPSSRCFIERDFSTCFNEEWEISVSGLIRVSAARVVSNSLLGRWLEERFLCLLPCGTKNLRLSYQDRYVSSPARVGSGSSSWPWRAGPLKRKSGKKRSNRALSAFLWILGLPVVPCWKLPLLILWNWAKSGSPQMPQ